MPSHTNVVGIAMCCRDCFARIVPSLLLKFRLEIPLGEMPPEVFLALLSWNYTVLSVHFSLRQDDPIASMGLLVVLLLTTQLTRRSTIISVNRQDFKSQQRLA